MGEDILEDEKSGRGSNNKEINSGLGLDVFIRF
jgi:hypothetical protein